MTPRPMRIEEEPAVRALVRRCHPTWNEKPTWWYVAHPTLVLEAEGEILGYTGFSVVRPPTGGGVMFGEGLGVDPSARGAGYGGRLLDARLMIARDLGLVTLIAMTWEANIPMIRIFERHGLTRGETFPGHFAENEPIADGIVYSGPVR